MRFEIRKKIYTKGVAVVKCCFKEKVQYSYVCSTRSECSQFSHEFTCKVFEPSSNSFGRLLF